MPLNDANQERMGWRGGWRGGEMSVWLQFNELVVPCEGGNPSEKSNGTLPASLKGDVIFSAMVQTEDVFKHHGKICPRYLVFVCDTHLEGQDNYFKKFFHHVFQTFSLQLCTKTFLSGELSP